MAPTFRHGKATAILANEYNLGSILNDSGSEHSLDLADTTVYGLNDRTYLAGQADHVVTYSGLFDGSNSTSALGVPRRMQSVMETALGSTSGTVNTYGPEGPGNGRRARLFYGLPEGLKIGAPANEVVSVEVGQFMAGRMGYGHWLVDSSTALSGASTHTAVDNAVATAFGGVVHAHVHQYATTGTWTFKVQHSSGGAYSDLTTARSLNAATRYVRVEVTGTVKRYTKAVVSAVTAASAPRFGCAVGRYYS